MFHVIGFVLHEYYVHNCPIRKIIKKTKVFHARGAALFSLREKEGIHEEIWGM
jgi:hypothetical protein